ncbi:hypothetical protein CVT25_008708 [Psilocybe cyanescens]|uniref:Glutamyl-tRNA(Gln) amidotransferase subunit F, mitochondrial n=1 Tax=Psilocybe cyanescens TaxID=93625 RepID=A0A409XNQ8_PSICY|nr:hypothetical protein CVT25_008708 [Psilocybe cyanescens]
MALHSLQRCLRQPTRSIVLQTKSYARRNSSQSHKHDTDSCGIPLQPTWSLNHLLSSYPLPGLSSATVNRLYELSALIPPREGTKQYETVKADLEEMVKLVEAVRLVNTSSVSITGRGEKEDADRQTSAVEQSQSGEVGQELLKHASQTTGRFYVVDAERKR